MNRLTYWWDDWHGFMIPFALVIIIVAVIAIAYHNTYSCPDCGHTNQPAANYCEKCGRQLRL